ncbi:hypothetical protein GIV19_08340 [Pseudomonas syringae]|uniref:hypothetical protein n=1 Tax=Pseudomonas syringae TaxID=317 RepID=UPI001F29C3D1|nr:hypothetical protein [Pseudomonas syringae]MCF5707297.1 hypothetical protein [Pseudomonas syringae]
MTLLASAALGSALHRLIFLEGLGADAMSCLVSSIMEFDARMDVDLNHEICALLSAIAQQSQQCAGCELRKAQGPRGWIVECTWRDPGAMHNHFSSPQLQALIRLLVSRSSRIVFDIPR